jgi:hypothetical protein
MAGALGGVGKGGGSKARAGGVGNGVDGPGRSGSDSDFNSDGEAHFIPGAAEDPTAYRADASSLNDESSEGGGGSQNNPEGNSEDAISSGAGGGASKDKAGGGKGGQTRFAEDGSEIKEREGDVINLGRKVGMDITEEARLERKRVRDEEKKRKKEDKERKNR